jgi:putative transposase
MNYKFALSRPLEGQIKTVTIKRDTCGRLFICFSVVQEVEPNEVSTNKIGGFDFGLKTFLTDDEGRVYQSPQYYRANMNEIARLNRSLARKQKGSGNWTRTKKRLAKAHATLANKRGDFHFKLAKSLLDQYDALCFEDLNIEAMKRLWGRKVSDLGFATFKATIESQAKARGRQVVTIGRFEPSSQTCSFCGHRQPMGLTDRVFEWSSCGAVIDRDHNAARNIRSWGVNSGLESIRRSETAALA